MKREVVDHKLTLAKLLVDATTERKKLESFLADFSPEFVAAMAAAPPLSDKPPTPAAVPNYSKVSEAPIPGSFYHHPAPGMTVAYRKEDK